MRYLEMGAAQAARFKHLRLLLPPILDFCLAPHQIQDRFLTVSFRALVGLDCFAGKAAVKEHDLARFQISLHRLHHALAALHAISGVDVHVLAPQAYRTMISVPATLDEFSTMTAGKFLHPFLKSLGHFFKCEYVITAVFERACDLFWPGA